MALYGESSSSLCVDSTQLHCSTLGERQLGGNGKVFPVLLEAAVTLSPQSVAFSMGSRVHPVACVSPVSEMSEMKEMLRQQQEQLDQLTQNIALMQRPLPQSHSVPRGPVICRRCQRPGHFARECNGVCAPPCSQFSSQTFWPSARQPAPAPEN